MNWLKLSFLVLLFSTQSAHLTAQEFQKEKPTFTLSIEEDKEAARVNPALHRLLVRFTRVVLGDEVEQFHEEAEGMYNMIVLHNGILAAETDAMRDLASYRRVDDNPNIRNPRLLRPGESWTTPLDVSDYYDMSGPGTYLVTVTRESQPFNRGYGEMVRSNSIAIVVPEDVGAIPSSGGEKPKPRFSLTLSELASTFVSPNRLRVEMDNTSSTTIRERKCWPFLGMYNLTVLRDGTPLEGNDATKRLVKSRSSVNCPGNETLIEIKPGEIYAETVPLRDFVDVDTPGSYVVYVTRETYPWNPAKSVVVESNSISFVVPQSASTGESEPTNGLPARPQYLETPIH